MPPKTAILQPHTATCPWVSPPCEHYFSYSSFAFTLLELAPPVLHPVTVHLWLHLLSNAHYIVEDGGYSLPLLPLSSKLNKPRSPSFCLLFLSSSPLTVLETLLAAASCTLVRLKQLWNHRLRRGGSELKAKLWKWWKARVSLGPEGSLLDCGKKLMPEWKKQ